MPSVAGEDSLELTGVLVRHPLRTTARGWVRSTHQEPAELLPPAHGYGGRTIQ